jgi:hypothetical protein
MTEFTLDSVELTKKRSRPNIYADWLRSEGVSEINISALFQKYHIGVSKKHIHGGMYSPIFWQIDASGNVVGGRTIGLREDNRIVFSPIGRSVASSKENYHLFGEHLLKDFPERTVKIFPFEFLAIRASLLYPESNCIAITTESDAVRRRVREYLPSAEWM